MSIVAQADPVSPILLLVFAALALGAIGIAWRVPVTTPQRARSLPPAAPLLTIALIAMVLWMVTPSILAGLLMRPSAPDEATPPASATQPLPATTPASMPAEAEPAPATAPATTTAPSLFERLTARQIASINLLAPLLTLLFLLVAATQARPSLVGPIGLSPAGLPPAIPLGLLSLLVVLPLVMTVSILTALLWQSLGLTHDTAHPLLQIFSNDRTWLTRAIVIAAASLAAPLYEEVLFRGFLQTAFVSTLSTRMGPRGAAWTGILLASLLFTIIHTWWMQPIIFVLSLALGWVYERRGNLWTPIVLHAGFNTASTLLFASSLPG